MKIVAVISVTRDDSTVLTREVRVETERVWNSAVGQYRPETKDQTRKRFERHLVAARNATLGR